MRYTFWDEKKHNSNEISPSQKGPGVLFQTTYLYGRSFEISGVYLWIFGSKHKIYRVFHKIREQNIP